MTGTFFGGYFLSSLIYRTNNSEIYESSNPENCTKLAVKLLKKNSLVNSDSIDEVNFNKEIDCNYIMPMIEDITDISSKEYSCGLVMKLALGGDLHSLVEDERGLKEETAAQAIHAGLKALQYLHNKGICHRDVKPDNFFLMDDNENELDIVLGDLGHAAYITNEKFTDYNVGNANFNAPEIHKRIPYDESIDIWSLGVTMYMSLACYSPFPDDYLEMREAICSGTYDFDDEIWLDISNLAKDLIISMLQVNPKNRISIEDALNHPWFKEYYVEYGQQENRVQKERGQNHINLPLNEADIFASDEDDFFYES